MNRVPPTFLFALLCLTAIVGPRDACGSELDRGTRELLHRFCVDCHGEDEAEAGVSLESLLKRESQPDGDSFATRFRTWQKAAGQLEQKRMPPAEADQPSPSQRRKLASSIRSGIAAAAKKHDGDPGHVLIRRLTSAEYGYVIRDLTGIDYNVESGFVSDAVGGAGFTNTGLVQFTEDATLERYLEAARDVADHAVVGTGPLTFFRDPGRTGFELSAIDRIQNIYRTHGFRTAAGEGGKPFGIHRYQSAFLCAWMYRHPNLAGPGRPPTGFARALKVDPRFVEYMHSVLTRENPSFPTSEIVDAWEKLPSYEPDLGRASISDVAERCGKLSKLLLDWQNRFGANTDAKEEAPVLRADLFDVKRTQPFEMNINWPKGTKTAHLVLSVESANRNGTPDAVILWRDAKIQFRDYAKVLQDPKPLRGFLTEKTVKRLGFGKHPRGGKVGQNGFVTIGTKPPSFELPILEGSTSARMLVTAELDVDHGEDCIVRCTIAQLEETDQGKSVSGLLASPRGDAFATWKKGVLEFAELLPQISQREPAPSDRDPIPAPFDATYNNAERNFFHTRIKYFRDDAFLVKNILDDETRKELDQAWADLLGSFEFHEIWLQYLGRKFDLKLDGRRIADLDEKWIAAAPTEARGYLKTLKSDFNKMRSMFQPAESRHIDDVVQLAGRAWRRPLSANEESELRAFYRHLRNPNPKRKREDRAAGEDGASLTLRVGIAQASKLDHRAAISALIARVLVSPAFLYRAERASVADPKDGSLKRGDEASPLTSAEIASRLSFLVWSSMPDEELREAATSDLNFKLPLKHQLRRMLSNSKSRRFSTEFFGQWFGFYRFDQFRGIDVEQFPEFTDSLRRSMYLESVEFFHYIVRLDRPVNEILFADYSFLNPELALHYGIDLDLEKPPPLLPFQQVEKSDRFHRGGLLRLGAVLATTSAPRRTSPVKRGDWILRRVLGTVVPPPPADAGSLPADEVVADGRSIRKRLLAHRRDSSCHNCHSRFDAFGFALENYDPLGRWRENYRDQNPVETTGVLRDGTKITGDAGLHEYLLTRQSQFHETLARKLLGYALGRRETVGDLALIRDLTEDMRKGSGMASLLERIVTSRQFRYHR